MSSNKTSEYIIEVDVNDNTRDAIRGLERSLKDISDKTSKASNESFHAVNNTAKSMIQNLHKLATDSNLDAVTLAKSFERQSQKTINTLEHEYIKQKDKADGLQKEYDKILANVSKYEAEMNKASAEQRSAIRSQLDAENAKLNAKQRELDSIKAYIDQNRQLRADLKEAAILAKIDAAETKKKADRAKNIAKLEDLQAKRKAATNKAEKKELDEKIKQQKAYIKAIEQAEKITQKTTEQTSKLGKAWEFVLKRANRLNKMTQYIYNSTGMISGAVRAGKAVAKAGFGIAQGIGSAISAVSSGADQEVERERQANRVKGMSNDDAKSLLRELNVYTGADYSTIVDAINRVQGTLGRGLQRGELTQAVEMELRYPGISTAFASATGTGEAGAVGFRHYASKLNAIQKATGASAEQIAASTQAFANRKDIRKSSAAVSDYQAVYLAMQNSGAFESEEELNSVFDKFVQKHISSGKDVFEFAETFKMADYVHDTRNKIQAKTADSNMNWRQFAKDVRGSDGNEYGPSDAEKMAIKMREIEDKKNQLLMKLVPAVLPVVEKIADLITSPAGDQIIDGFVNLFKTVIPMLEPIFRALGVFLEFMSQTILPMFQWLVEKVSEFLGEQIDKAVDLLPQNANGGIATGPSIVGERAFQPEMILPLDYSRSSRAGNIIQSVSQTFNMSGNETTALSLSQAVKSRDFRRATAQNAFISARGGLL